MTALDIISELFPVILSSVGLTGSVFSAVIAFAIRKAKRDADLKRDERLKIEAMRLEGEEKMTALIFALIRQTRGIGSERELSEAEDAYTEYLDNCRRIKNEIISNHTSN